MVSIEILHFSETTLLMQ